GSTKGVVVRPRAPPAPQPPAAAAMWGWEEGLRGGAVLAFWSEDSGHTDFQPEIAHGPSDHADTKIKPACVHRPGGNRGVRETLVGMRQTKLKYGRAVQRV